MLVTLGRNVNKDGCDYMSAGNISGTRQKAW
jgi:hypothetical protein